MIISLNDILCRFEMFNFIFSILIAFELILFIHFHFTAITLFITIDLLEFAYYFGVIYVIFKCPKWFGRFVHIWGFLFVCILTTMIALTCISYEINQLYIFAFVNMICHGLVGIYLKSNLICATSIIFFMISLISKCTSDYDMNIIPVSLMISSMITLIGVYFSPQSMTTSDKINAYINPFSKKRFYLVISHFVAGMLSIGPLVMNISLLSICSQYYAGGTNYNNNNIIAFFCNLLAAYVGSVYNVTTLCGISGSTIILLLLSKILEFLPWNVEILVWLCLTIGFSFHITYIVTINAFAFKYK